MEMPRGLTPAHDTDSVQDRCRSVSRIELCQQPFEAGLIHGTFLSVPFRIYSGVRGATASTHACR